MDTYDAVKKPPHYCFSNIQPKDAIRDWELNFNLGCVVKYVVRAGRKGDKIEDLRKAAEYLTYEIEALEKEKRRAAYFSLDSDMPPDGGAGMV